MTIVATSSTLYVLHTAYYCHLNITFNFSTSKWDGSPFLKRDSAGKFLMLYVFAAFLSLTLKVKKLENKRMFNMSVSLIQNSNTTIKTTWWGWTSALEHFNHNNTTMIITWQGWFRCRRHLVRLSQGSREHGRRSCSSFHLRGKQVLSLIKIGFYAMIGD